MKTKFFILLIVATLTFNGLVLKANAQSTWHPNCWYISGYAGPALHREMDIRFDDPTSVNVTQDLITDYRTGYGLGGAIGAVFCRSWRLEIEGYFRNFHSKEVGINQDSGIAGALLPCTCDEGCLFNVLYNPSSHYRSFSIMANGFYDFCLCQSVAWYVGGGIGPSWVEYKVVPSGTIFTFSAKISEVRFSYQLMTGIVYRFCNHVSATIGYRLWGTTKDTDASGSFAGATYKVSERRVPLVNSVEFGLRYAF